MSGPRKRWLALAGAVLMALTVGASLPAFADPTDSTVTGVLTDGGAPVVGATVILSQTPPMGGAVYEDITDDAGAYAISGVAAGQYRMQFVLQSFTTQWAHGKGTAAEADIITIEPSSAVTIDEAIRPHGSITGRVTNPDGTPAALAFVRAEADTPPFSSMFDTTDADGVYTLPHVWPGTYTISFGSGGATQYAHQKTNQFEAEKFTIAGGTNLTVDETLLPRGAIVGRLTDHGAPVASAFVVAHGEAGSGTVFGSTNSNGEYRIVGVPGVYTVEFRLSGGLSQWAHGKRSQTEADPITITAGAETIVNEEVITPGTVSGRLVDADGNPVSTAFVSLTDNVSTSYFASTAEDGSFSMLAFPGTYQLSFSTQFGTQYARGKSNSSQADPIVVTSGESTVVNETLVRTGTIELHAKDKTTGQPIQSFCAIATDPYVCTSNGTLELAQLPGTYSVNVFADELGYVSGNVTAVVVSGETTAITVSMVRGATIRMSVTDRGTGAPVEGVCVNIAEPLNPSNVGEAPMTCSGPDGALTFERIRPGVYNAFAAANDGVHGHQWVGTGGGTGSQATSRLIVASPGATVTVPAIKMDRAGRIVGRVTDKTTGAGIAWASVSVSSANGRAGGGLASALVEPDGRYTFEGLGPYEWTLHTSAPEYAAQFSGGVSNRFLAQGVKVRAGRTTTFDVRLTTGTTLHTIVTGPNGETPEYADVAVINALTGDEVDRSASDIPPPYTAQVLGPQLVKLYYSGRVGGVDYQGWLGGSDFAHAQIFLVPATGSKTVEVRMT